MPASVGAHRTVATAVKYATEQSMLLRNAVYPYLLPPTPSRCERAPLGDPPVRPARLFIPEALSMLRACFI